MYEAELKLAELSKCECQMSCKWPPPRRKSDGTSQPLEGESGGTGGLDKHKASAAAEQIGEQQMGARPGAPGRARQDNQRNLNASLAGADVKLDGQVWQSGCDICSCHVSAPRPTGAGRWAAGVGLV